MQFFSLLPNRRCWSSAYCSSSTADPPWEGTVAHGRDHRVNPQGCLFQTIKWEKITPRLHQHIWLAPSLRQTCCYLSHHLGAAWVEIAFNVLVTSDLQWKLLCLNSSKNTSLLHLMQFLLILWSAYFLSTSLYSIKWSTWQGKEDCCITKSIIKKKEYLLRQDFYF